MEIYDYVPFILFLAFEVLLLLGLYFFVLRYWIADHLEDRFREDEGSWLVDILSPAINEICDTVLSTAPNLVLDTLKGELLSNQGNLARVSKADPDNEQEVGLEIAEMFLKELGIKKPSVIMTLRAGKGLLELYNSKKGGQKADKSTPSLPVGKSLFK